MSSRMHVFTNVETGETKYGWGTDTAACHWAYQAEDDWLRNYLKRYEPILDQSFVMYLDDEVQWEVDV